MLEIDKTLNYDEQILIGEMIDRYQITKKNFKVLLKYYHHFGKTLYEVKKQRSHIKTIAEIALIFTEKSNFYRTLEGKSFPGISFSVNNILKSKSHFEIQNLTNATRQLLQKVKLRQNSLKLSVQKLVCQIQQGLQEAIFFEKLCLAFYQNTLQLSKQFQIYKQKLISFAWYLYIDTKQNCIKKDGSLLEKKFMMISVLENVVLNSLAYINPLILQKSSPKGYSVNSCSNLNKKQLMSQILQILLQEAKITKNQIIGYHAINELFNSYFDSLIYHSIIKSISGDSFDFLCYRSLDINLRKIDRKISKEIESNEVDLRKFIYYEMYNQNGHKKTAIEDKLIIKHKKCQKNRCKQGKYPNGLDNNKTFKSHRILDLDKCDFQMSSSSGLNDSQINFPLNLSMLPVRMNIPLLHKTCQKSELQTFIFEKSCSYMSQIKSYEPTIMQFIEQVFDEIIEQYDSGLSLSSENALQAYQLYILFAEMTWAANIDFQRQQKYSLEQTDSTHQCLLILSIGSVLLNACGKDEDYFSKIIAIKSPDVIDLLYSVIFILQLNLPEKLRSSLKFFEARLINYTIWKDQDFIQEISLVAQEFCHSKIETPEIQAMSCILQRVSIYSVQMVTRIEGLLKKNVSSLKDFQLQEWKTNSVNSILSMIVFSPQIIYEQFLDLIILCNMFGISKRIKMQLKLHQLILTYKQIIGNDDELFEKTILNVKSNFNQQQSYKSIIEFYNQQFLSHFIRAFQTTKQRQNMQVIKRLVNWNYSPDQRDIQQNGDIFVSPQKDKNPRIMLSPRLKRNRSPIMGLNTQDYIGQKENVYQQINEVVNINIQGHLTGELGIFSYISQSNVQNKTNSQKSEINFELNNARNPTRIKQRKPINERYSQLCATQRTKHPIFTEFRDDRT